MADHLMSFHIFIGYLMGCHYRQGYVRYTFCIETHKVYIAHIKHYICTWKPCFLSVGRNRSAISIILFSGKLRMCYYNINVKR